MRWIVIDSERKEVREVNIVEPSLDAMQSIVDGLIERAHEIDDVNEIYVNEEGLLGNPQHFFFYEGAHQPFAGSGVVVGHDNRGNTVATTLTLNEVKKKVRFMDQHDVVTMVNGL